MRKIIITLLFISFSFASEIKWFSYEEGLKKAKEEDKLILMDIYAQWCHWCNVIENTAYRDERVVNLINRYYIPIRVDAEKRPEINKKYNQGGLPSTLILDKKGNILWGGIYVSPEDMVKLLTYFKSLSPEEIKEIAHKNKLRLELYEKRFLKRVKAKEPSVKYIKKVFKSIRIRFDRENGGFYGRPKFPEEELPHFLILYNLFMKDKEAKDMLIKTLEGYQKLIDPIEGGIYRYSANEFWTQPHYEKLLKDQADLSVMFFDTYSYLKNPEYLKSAISLINFSIKKLYSKQKRFFYNSQGADIVDENGTLLMSGEEYFVLDREGRKKAEKKLGYSPKIEKEIYFRTNALISKALFYAYGFTGEEKYLNIGEKVLKNIINNAFTPKGIIYAPTIKKYFLNSNVYTLEALLTAYQLTGNKYYLKKAEELFKILKENYYSKKINLFTDLQDTGLNYNRISFIDNLITLNRRLSYCIYQLFLFTNDRGYLSEFNVLIKHMPVNINIDTALGFFIKIYPPLMTHIIGNSEFKTTAIKKSFKIFPYWNFIQFINSKDKDLLSKINYPPSEKPVAYICNKDMCFTKITAFENLRKTIFSIFKYYNPN